tara:strand:- start:406 stop:768 length:363 start_codon:yes stop_codon:yes gene_type:complete
MRAVEFITEMDRRTFMKGAAVTVPGYLLGYGAYKLAKWSAEEDAKFEALIKDPNDLARYKKLVAEYNFNNGLADSNRTNYYAIQANILAGRISSMREELAYKYKFKLTWLGTVDNDGKDW